MNLILYANQDLDSLETLARANFQSIINQKLGDIFDVTYPSPFSSKEMCKIFKIKSLKKTDEIVLKFPFRPYHSEFRSNPLKLLSWLIGHEGRGSILENLIRLELATELSAYASNTRNCFTVFSIGINLTSKGMKEIEHVLEIVFRYIGMIKREGLPRRIFEEIQKIKELRFEYKSKGSGKGKALALARKMGVFPPGLLNKVDYLMEDYEPEKLIEAVGGLNPQNMVTYISNDGFEDLELTDEFYGTSFGWDSMEKGQIQKYQKMIENYDQFQGKFYLFGANNINFHLNYLN